MFSNKLKKIVYIFFLICLNACTSFTHYNKQVDLSKSGTQAVFVDAKQRGIFKSTWQDGDYTWEAICAEPAPGAISSLAASLGIDVTTTEKGKIGLSQALAEGVGSIGLRTAAIEALRDIMYRNCEAYALGAVSKFGLETLQRRFSSTMVGILAIEQLTGAVRAPATVIDSESIVGSPSAIVDLTKKTEDARKSLENAKAAESKIRAKYDSLTKSIKETEKKIKDTKEEAERIKLLDKPTENEKKILEEYAKLLETSNKMNQEKDKEKKDFETAKETTKGREQALKALDESRIATLKGNTSVSKSGKIEALPSKPSLSAEAIDGLSKAVVDIVKEVTTGQNYTSEICVTLIGQNPNIDPKFGSALYECVNLLRNDRLKDEGIMKEGLKKSEEKVINKSVTGK